MYLILFETQIRVKKIVQFENIHIPYDAKIFNLFQYNQ